jgi:hypothetical protein
MFARVFQEYVAGTFKEVGKIIYCCNFLILKLEERFHFRKTQLFQGLDTVGTHTVATTTIQLCGRCQEPLSRIVQALIFQHIFSVAPPPALRLMPTYPNN